ncbi:MAG: hypothetical protein ACE5I9_07570 [Candidatus Methylomirabilales bacterium]
MRPPVVAVLVVVAILIGFGIGYFWFGQQVARVQEELSDVRSKMGMEAQNLRNEVGRLKSALEEAERRLKEEQASRQILEESLKKARILK